MSEHQQPSGEASETPTDSWEVVAPHDAPAPEPAAVEAPAPVDPLPVEPVAVTEPEPPLPAEPPPPPVLPPPLPPPSAVTAPTDRPEIAIGGAFAGGLVSALILKRLAR